MSYEHFAVAEADGVLTVTLDRPDKLNSLTFDVYRDLVRLTADVATRGDVRALVLTGRGKGFCSGGDVEDIIGRLFERSMEEVLDFTRMTCAVVRNLRRMPQPVIAAINGTAAGAGAVLALASDLRVMVEKARIHFLFTKVGLTGADMGTAWLLPRVIGEARAKEVLYFGDGIDAEKALSWGLVHRVVAADELDSCVRDWTGRLTAGAREALHVTKQAMHAEAEMSFEAALELETVAQAALLKGRDHREFYEAFREKRDPRFGA